MNFETVIGLEVHVELKTKSKIFSPSPNAFGDEPNSNVNPIDLGYPGVLPVLNKEAVNFAMRAAMALNCDIATDTKFDRKTISIQTTRKLIKSLNLTSQSVKMVGLRLKSTVKRKRSVLLVCTWKKMQEN